MKLKPSFFVLIISYVASSSMGQENFENLDGKQKIIDQSTSLMARPGKPSGLAFRLNNLEVEFRDKFEEIKAQTSRISEDQEGKNAIIRVRERNLARLLNQTREEMEGLKTQNRDQSKRIDQLEQKVAALQNTPPASSALTKGNNNEKMTNEASNNSKSTKVMGIPTSCKDLQQLGHSLNGLYLIKKALPNNQGMKIQTAYCDFQSPTGTSSNVLQELVGNVDVKTRSVHFYVQRNSNFGTPNAVIPFELARLNEGGAFDLRSGIFTVPVPGIYHFDFSAVKTRAPNGLYILLQVNGGNVGEAYSRAYSHPPGTSVVALSASLRLAAGDIVRLFLGGGAIIDDSEHVTHFSGWLVTEDLM